MSRKFVTLMESCTKQSAAPVLPPAELLKKIHELELGHAHLKEEMSKLISSSIAVDPYHRQSSQSISPRRTSAGGGDGSRISAWKKDSASFQHASPLLRENKDARSGRRDAVGIGEGGGPAAVKFTDKQFLNILRSMGQSVHIIDMNCRIIYWNRSSQNLYGYLASEALGQDAFELLTDPRDFSMASNIVDRVSIGESWAGHFLVRTKRGDRLLVLVTNTPFYDDDGTLIGIICVANDSKPFQETNEVMSGPRQVHTDSSFSRLRSIASIKLGLDPQQPLPATISSKLSTLASKVSSKVKLKLRPAENNSDREGGVGESHHSDNSFSDAGTPEHFVGSELHLCIYE